MSTVKLELYQFLTLRRQISKAWFTSQKPTKYSSQAITYMIQEQYFQVKILVQIFNLNFQHYIFFVLWRRGKTLKYLKKSFNQFYLWDNDIRGNFIGLYIQNLEKGEKKKQIENPILIFFFFSEHVQGKQHLLFMNIGK